MPLIALVDSGFSLVNDDDNNNRASGHLYRDRTEEKKYITLLLLDT